MAMATRVAAGLFPRTSIADGFADNPVVAAAEKWLAIHQDAPQALRRIVLEGLDNTRRRLTTQRR